MKLLFDYNTINSVLFFALSLAALSVLLKGYLFLFASIADASSLIILIHLESRLNTRRHKEALTSEMLSSLQHIRTLLTRSKIPVSAALGRVAAVPHSREISKPIMEVKARLRVGQDFSQAVKSTKVSEPLVRESLQQIASSYSSSFDIVTAIKDTHSSMFREYLEKIERFYSSVQKYTSLGMVTGTIVPSFALFAIVGYSIINTSAGTFLPSLLFVVALPSIFSAIKLSYVEPYAP